MFTQFFILFSLIAVGYIACRKGWINNDSIDSIGNILMNIVIPSLLLSSIFSLDIEREVLNNFIIMTLLSAGFFVVYIILAKIYIALFKVPSKYSETIEISMIAPNNAFIGFPIAIAFFGNNGLLFMVASNMVMNIILYSYGTFLIKRSIRLDKNESNHWFVSIKNAIKQMINPNIIAIIVGLLLTLNGVTAYIPEPIDSLLTILGDIATPLSMIYIGATLFGYSLSELFNNRMIMNACIARILVLPLVTGVLLQIFQLPVLMSKIIFVVSFLPCAAIVPALVAEYGKRVDESVKLVLLSTLFSLGTMPLGVYLASVIF